MGSIIVTQERTIKRALLPITIPKTKETLSGTHMRNRKMDESRMFWGLNDIFKTTFQAFLGIVIRVMTFYDPHKCSPLIRYKFST